MNFDTQHTNIDNRISKENIEKWKSIEENIKSHIYEDINDSPNENTNFLLPKPKYISIINKNSPLDISTIKYIGGIDISFFPQNVSYYDACVCLVVLDFTSNKVKYTSHMMIKLTQPYITSYLAFREANFCTILINHLRQVNIEYYPEVILVDGNGILHPRGCGLACHIGYHNNIPTIGIAKNLLEVCGISRKFYDNNNDFTINKNHPLIDNFNRILGVALAASESKNPIFLSIGYSIDIQTAISIVQKCTKYRIPEPTRQADLISRDIIRKIIKNPNLIDSYIVNNNDLTNTIHSQINTNIY